MCASTQDSDVWCTHVCGCMPSLMQLYVRNSINGAKDEPSPHSIPSVHGINHVLGSLYTLCMCQRYIDPGGLHALSTTVLMHSRLSYIGLQACIALKLLCISYQNILYKLCMCCMCVFHIYTMSGIHVGVLCCITIAD